ncbi:MAG: malto-oligosyltrehalose trehalohydrolase [Verrucomicrobiales bacterium]|nr:malto-oligosyltrehalose trehalohydrolase [Verrucomicrobiales bacterium]
MDRREDGWFEVEVETQHGARYHYRADRKSRALPDPASRFQPEGVHGPSELFDPFQYQWESENWSGISERDLILYELHVGAFTPEGTFAAAINRLDELVDLGVTALELMPVAQSAGRWNWGYDGVNLFAPRNTYGRPEDMMALIDAAHQRGLAVILDVVYNHFGPEGNYLAEFGGYLSEKHSTPWGDAPDFDGEYFGSLRRFYLENVRYWVEGFRVDGLRLDAAHCMIDHSKTHIVEEVSREFQKLKARLGRQCHLIAESNVYDPEMLVPLEDGGFGIDALWCDDFIHSINAILRPGKNLSVRSYEPMDIDLILRRGYVFHGTLSTERIRHLLDEFPEKVGIESLVVALQNHDFIGNDPGGERLHQLTSTEAQRAVAALLILQPSIPMLFMGEEFASESPFYFFTDFGDEKIRRAVEQGRKEEHPLHDWNNIVSPISDAAFLDSKLLEASAGNQQTLEWYRTLLEIRKAWIAAEILSSTKMTATWDPEMEVAQVVYQGDPEGYIVLVRLHSPNHDVGSFRLSFTGECILSQGTELVVKEGRCELTIDPFGVAILRGSLIEKRVRL